jgi:putative Ca2+/H+ antiporter (TMEM165/GDT1 family)
MSPPLPSDPGLAAFASSLTAITLAELGDKTFFMALILAVRHSPRLVFAGAFMALSAVTLLSLAVGAGVRELLPPALVPWLAALLFLGFGIKLLIDANQLGSGAADVEAQEAQEAVNAAERHQGHANSAAVLWEAFSLVFVAELGDRTQFATIFLATAPAQVFSFAGLLSGTLLGHALVTGLAVGAGRWIGGRVNEPLLYRLSGGLFVMFGLSALLQALASVVAP